jgi:AbrB family looped-hinge helix DNA binding protein
MRITTKGQVTIPVEIREKLGLFPHTEVTFRIDGASVRLEKAQGTAARGAAVVARLRGRGKVRLTTDEIMRLTRQ